MLASGTTIQHLRVHAPGAGSAEAARAQRVVRGWLDELAPAHYGLPAQAIVVVRRLQTRLPALLPGSPWPDPLVPLLRGAARPARQRAVGAAAAAVWFSDEAELLACLARDALAACPAWWWPLLLGRQPDVALAAARWCRAPTQVPRAWQQLQADERDAWPAAMGSAARRELLSVVCSAFVVCDAVQAWLREGEVPPSSAWPDASGAGGGGVAEAEQPRQAPAAGAGLQRLLQALATDAMAAASTVHAAPWCPELSAPPPGPAALAPRVACAAQDRAVAKAATDAAASVLAPALGIAGPRTPLPGTVPAQPGPASGAAAASGPGLMPAAAPRSGAAAVRAGLNDTPQASAPRPMGPAHHAAGVEPAPEALLDTDFGGLFFLLNVALAMGLYGDFTQPRATGLAHTPWQFLSALGGHWAGPGWRSDALSPWLRARAATQPWPRQTGAQPSAAADRQSPGVAPVAGCQRPAPRDRLAGLAPTLAQRLAGALGLPRPRPAVALTLRLPARLRATAGRVDLHFMLASLPLALRLAGLDRDPGWIPAAGCDFRFHFD